MISFFPKPYPDELLYSMIARYHAQSGNTTYRQTAMDLFGNKKNNNSLLLPVRLGALARQTDQYGLSLNKILLKHTSLPYYSAFMQEEAVERIIAWAENNDSGSSFLDSGMYGAKVSTPKKLMFCPLCYNKDLEQYGEGYWHREHQIPGIITCHRHGTYLLESTVSCRAHECPQCQNAEIQSLFPAVYPEPLSPLGMQQAMCVAEDIAFIFANYYRIRSAFLKHNGCFCNLFLFMLRTKGLATKGGLRIQEYRKQFAAYYDTDYLIRTGAAFDETVKRPWIISLCRGKNENSKNAHPLYYILLSRFLCGGLENLIQAAEALQPTELEIAADPPPQNVAFYEEKRKVYRTRWMKACDAMPGACQNDIRKCASAVYTWLYRHDQEWLSNHPKERKARGGNQSFADWRERDIAFSGRITEAAEKIRVSEGRPEWISRRLLLLKSGCGDLAATTLEKLPLTKAAIEREAESKMEYRLRKMCWAERELKRRGECITKWKILRLASIHRNNEEECWEMYQKELTVRSKGDYAS